MGDLRINPSPQIKKVNPKERIMNSKDLIKPTCLQPAQHRFILMHAENKYYFITSNYY